MGLIDGAAAAAEYAQWQAQRKNLMKAANPTQKKAIKYFIPEPGCKGLFDKVSDEEYDAIVKDMVKSSNSYQRALDKIGLDESELKEIPPVTLYGYEEGKNSFSKTNVDGTYRTNLYSITHLFFSATQVYMYQLVLNTMKNDRKERTEEYFYKDITNFSTLSDTVESRRKKGLTDKINKREDFRKRGIKMSKPYVEIIQATKEMYAPKTGRKKKRVAPYCRVSTAEEEQQDSFENQVNYYKIMVDNNPDWELVDIFGDEGISGTSAEKRPDFRRMIKMCEQGKIDLIVTKSISRFSRNTSVTLEYVRRLKLMGIGIIFEKEKINTLEESSEFMLSMYSTFAQEESESQSRNVKMGKRFKYSQGQVCFNFNRVYGYGQDSEKNIYIIPEQAAAVKLIFASFQKGLSLREIADTLEEEKILSPSGKQEWKTEAVKRILVNEKYAGNVMTQKTYIVDPISKKTRKNTGELPKYFIRNHHVPIIEPEIFDAVQIELSRRNCIKKNENKNDYGKYSGKYPFNNMIVCGECGTKYRRTMWVTRDKQKEYVWRCMSRLEHGKKKCKHSPSIKEEFLISAVTEAANSMITDVVYAKEILKGAIAEVMGDNVQNKLNENSARMNELNERLSQTLSKNLNGEISIEEMDKIFSEVRDEQLKLRHENDAYEKRRQAESADHEKLKTIFKTIDEMPEEIDRLADDNIRMLFDRIEIVSKKEMRICSGDYAYTVNM